MARDRMLLLALLSILAGCVNSSDGPNPDPRPSASESESLPYEPPLNPQEMASLKAMHHNAVEQFAALPMFGGQRMIVRQPIDDVITPPSPSEAQTATKPTGNSPRALATKPGQPERDIHFSFRQLLGYSGVMLKDEYWKLKEIQLVGLTVHPNPVVYETDKVPGMKDVAELPTRELNAFEKRALASLKNGELLKLERQSGTARLMGPIYAGKKCLNCHEQPGQLLGAFSYVLERAPMGEVVTP